MPVAGQLIPANTTVLRPGTNWFRMVNAFMGLDANAALSQQQTQLTAQSATQSQQQTQITGNGNAITTLQNEVATLQSEVASLQGQINTINARLAAAGIP